MTKRPPFPSVIDSSMIAAFRSCPYKANLDFFLHWKPKSQSVHLHAGAAYAKALEVARTAYYLGEYHSPQVTTGFDDQGAQTLHVTWEIDQRDPLDSAMAIEAGLRAMIASYGSFTCPPDSAKSLERMCGAYEYYFTQYPLETDRAVPVTLPSGRRGIEFSFAEPIDETHPETGDPLLYVGRMDMICEFAGGWFGEDDKTTSQLGASWSKQWDLRCFDAKTELLTAAGWKTIDKIVEGEAVIQYSNGGLEYAPAADVHRSHHEGIMVAIENGRLNQLVTPNHRILLNLRRGGTKVVEAGNLLREDSRHKVPLAGHLAGEKLPAAVQKYIVALQADGSLRYSKGKVDSGRGHREHTPCPAAYFTFSKHRKVDRLISILEEIGVDFEHHADGGIYVSGFSDLQELAMNLLDERKCFKPDTFDLYDETFLDELEYWDGWASQYYTTSRQNAEFVQTVAHTNGRRASVQLKINHTQSYVVCLSNQITCELGAAAISDYNWDDYVYCVSVPSGFLLTRRGGAISVSGNSQFTGYCWGAAKAGFPLSGFLVRGVSILKTKYETQQAITYRPQWMIDRWYEQLMRDVKRMKEMWASGAWDVSLDHACAEYGGCPYRQPCLSQDPAPWLEGAFERRKWDPVARTETLVLGD